MPKGIYIRTKEDIEKRKNKMVGNSFALGKRWKVRDTSKYIGQQNGKGNKGNKLTEEHKRKIGNSNKGKNLGKKRTEEWKRNRSLSQIGDKNPKWRGGTSTENERVRGCVEYEIWRNAVLVKDNFTCQKTGIRGGNLVVHHIQNFAKYPELRFAIDNGITLSEKSHNEFHKIYGRENSTIEQLNKFLKR